MTAREYLSQAFHIDQRINSKLSQVMRLRETATNCTATLSDMPRPDSPNRQRMAETPSARSWIWSGRSTRTSTGWWT